MNKGDSLIFRPFRCFRPARPVEPISAFYGQDGQEAFARWGERKVFETEAEGW
jgi:hypothetical protein